MWRVAIVSRSVLLGSMLDVEPCVARRCWVLRTTRSRMRACGNHSRFPCALSFSHNMPVRDVLLEIVGILGTCEIPCLPVSARSKCFALGTPLPRDHVPRAMD